MHLTCQLCEYSPLMQCRNLAEAVLLMSTAAVLCTSAAHSRDSRCPPPRLAGRLAVRAACKYVALTCDVFGDDEQGLVEAGDLLQHWDDVLDALDLLVSHQHARIAELHQLLLLHRHKESRSAHAMTQYSR